MPSIPLDRQEPCNGPPDTGAWKNWNQAGAQAYYACRYFAAVQDTNTVRNIIAAAQAITQVYFADQQYKIAKQAQDRLDGISTIELARSGKLFAQFEKQIDEEDAQLADAANIDVPEPDWNAIRLRVTASVIRQFTEAKRKVLECYPANCAEAQCNALGKLETEQAKAIASEVEQAYQKERALWELRKETRRAHRLQVLQFGRGALSGASAALQGAQAAIIQSYNINPNFGFTQAINSIAQTAQGISTQGALSYRGMGANVSNAWGLGQTANNTATELMGSPASAMNFGNTMNSGEAYGMQQMLEVIGNGNISGETFERNNSAIATQLSGPIVS